MIPTALAGTAKNGAWISLLLSLVMGMLLLTCILYLRRKFPGMTFIGYSRLTIGRWLAFLIAVPYVCTLIWQVAGIVINVTLFLSSTMLRQTPKYIIIFMFFLISALTARAGFNAIARMFVVLLFVMYGFIISIWVLAAPHYHPEYLQPVMPDGIKPILHGTYIAYAFPYVEVVLYATLLPLVRKTDARKTGRMMVIALFIHGITFVTSIVCSIMAFGPLTGDFKYSLYQLARLIFIGDIIERIESVIGMALILGSYIKTTIFLYILVKILSELFDIQDNRLLTYPAGFICFLLSITMYFDEPTFAEDIYVMWPLMNSVTYVLPVLLITVVAMFKKRVSH
jgi:spore germination protein KB